MAESLSEVIRTIRRHAYIAGPEYVFDVWVDNISFFNFYRKAKKMDGCPTTIKYLPKWRIFKWIGSYISRKNELPTPIQRGAKLYAEIESCLLEYEKGAKMNV